MPEKIITASFVNFRNLILKPIGLILSDAVSIEESWLNHVKRSNKIFQINNYISFWFFRPNDLVFFVMSEEKAFFSSGVQLLCVKLDNHISVVIIAFIIALYRKIPRSYRIGVSSAFRWWYFWTPFNLFL